MKLVKKDPTKHFTACTCNMVCVEKVKLTEAQSKARLSPFVGFNNFFSRNEALKNVRDGVGHNKRNTQSAAMTKPNKKVAYCTECRFFV